MSNQRQRETSAPLPLAPTPSPIDDTSRNLAQWLRAVARGQRSIPPVPHPAPSQPSERVLEYLEQRIGRKLRSREAVDGYVNDVDSQRSQAQRNGMRRGILRGALLVTALLAAFLQYYYWNVNLEIAALPNMVVFIPVNGAQ